MNTFIKVSIFLLLSQVLLSQGTTWDSRSWEEVTKSALESKKLIFLDFYTTWCAPCLKMDKDIFPKEEVASFFNGNFISLKVNAEDLAEGSALAKHYEVGVYPTLMFVNGHGVLMSSFVGMKTKYELLDIARQNVELYDNYEKIEQVKANIGGDFENSELKKILEVSKIHEFPGKQFLAMKFLDQIENISEDDLRLVMDQISNMDLAHISRLAPLTTSLSYNEMYVRRNSKEWIAWKTNTERAIYDHLYMHQKRNNLREFEATLEVLKNVKGITPRQIDNLYLAFYKQNDLDQYRTFATFLIDEHIIPVRPDDVKDADEEKYERLYKEIMKDMEVSYGSNATQVLEDDEPTTTPLIDSLSQIYSISRTFADQLYEISSDFFAFYEDDSSRRKATFWASLAHMYYPYAYKYFDNHIYLLEAQGMASEAESVRNKMKGLPWYSEMKPKNQF